MSSLTVPDQPWTGRSDLEGLEDDPYEFPSAEAEDEGPEQPSCVSCRLGLHSECIGFWSSAAIWPDCCCGGSGELSPQTTEPAPRKRSKGTGDAPARTPVDEYFEFDGRKALADYADPISTGRKDAAVKFPITVGMKCEWAMQKNCGGGPVPIVGCPGYAAEAIHHGPDKNTMRNEVGNVHRICAECHNRWHALNDSAYGPRPAFSDGTIDASVPFIPLSGVALPHTPTPASPAEVFAEEERRIAVALSHAKRVTA